MNWLSEFFPAAISGFLFGMLTAFVLGVFLFGSVIANHWQSETIERGLAQYCPQTGDWAWIGECEE